MIIDEAIGDALGTVEVHFHLDSETSVSNTSPLSLLIHGKKNANVLLQGFKGSDTSGNPVMVQNISLVSSKLGQEKQRPMISFAHQKRSKTEIIRFITVMVPLNSSERKQVPPLKINAHVSAPPGQSYGQIELNFDGQRYVQNYSYDPEGMQMTPPPDDLVEEPYYTQYYNNFRIARQNEGAVPVRLCNGQSCDHTNTLKSYHRHLKFYKNSLVVVNKTKSFVYCGIPKCGVSKWRRLARKVEGIKEWKDHKAHSKESGLKYLSDIFKNSSQTAHQFVNDPRMFMFTIVRNPYARVLSAWLDKRDFPKFGIPKTFPEFIKYVVNTPDNKMNEHFASISSKCGFTEGIRYDAIFKLEDINVWGHRLVKKLNIADGLASEWTGGFFQRTSKHDTHADSKLHQYYTPALKAQVRWRYREDFKLFGYDPEALTVSSTHTSYEALFNQ